MPSKEESWAALRAERWNSEPAVVRGMQAGKCAIQSGSDGSGAYVCDQYTVTIARMPPSLAPGDYMAEIADNPNGAVGNGGFNVINVFTRRSRGTPPAVGEIYDINIAGPNNGSVVLAELSPGFGQPVSMEDVYFRVQTVSCEKTGSHPEYGAREFGCQQTARGTVFYTRGVSRPGSWIIGLAGRVPQTLGWRWMMQGIAETVMFRGGTFLLGSMTVERTEQA